MTKLKCAYDKLDLLEWMGELIFKSKNFEDIERLRGTYIEMLEENTEHDCKASPDSGCEVCDLLDIINDRINDVEFEMEKYKD